ncbi:MAG: hypothetical protein NZZ41_01790 [Candidatus Dojkabacteria bacterium]|nr:hypothetical protein [Candidatus Dojkabacteria bacterium]
MEFNKLNLQYKVIEEFKSELNQFNGVILVNKPKNVYSHDVVNYFRKKLNIRKVGHAGALDPFASGLLIILVGKYTKKHDVYLNMDKEYYASFLFGISTDSYDVDGKITCIKNFNFNEKSVIDSFKVVLNQDYQTVPLFSSVKVDGIRLRKIARNACKINFIDSNVVELLLTNGQKKIIHLPRKKITVHYWEIKSIRFIDIDTIVKYLNWFDSAKLININIKSLKKLCMPVVTVKMCVSKGFYVRSVARDIHNLTGIPVLLLELCRTKINGFDINMLT